MAVAARTPGPSDARVPCPLCGGLIHPIAGRCKHCKAELAALRLARPAATAALPPLAAPPLHPAPAGPPPVGIPGGGTSLHAPSPPHAVTHVAHAAPHAVIAAAVDESRPILPPRPTGRHQAAPPRSVWRSWPVIVIVLAVAAIATAVVLMLWPPPAAAKAESQRPRGPMPAPERMDTNPLPPQGPRGQLAPPSGGSTDPWSNRGTVPRQPPPPTAPDDPDAPSSIDPDDIFADPFANPRGRGGSGRGAGGLGGNPFGSMGAGNALVFSMVKRACDQLKSCPGASASAMASMCTMIDQSFGQLPLPPASCVAAQRCLAQIDKLDLCGTKTSPFGGGGSDLADITMLLSTAQDCLDAARC